MPERAKWREERRESAGFGFGFGSLEREERHDEVERKRKECQRVKAKGPERVARRYCSQVQSSRAAHGAVRSVVLAEFCAAVIFCLVCVCVYILCAFGWYYNWR